ncbi:MAG: hypothetical protein LBM07_06520 [Culturomica sp.]|jgi:hypothetical protein|nr:hypothetical protein [Culturomica sp.]
MSSRLDFIPGADAQFNIWQGVWFNSIEKNAETWGIPSDVVLTTSELKSKWETTYSVVENPVTKTSITVQSKNVARKEYEKQVRMVVKYYIAYNLKVSDEDKMAMGLPLHKTTRTPVPVPDTVPDVTEIDRNKIRCLTISFRDSGSDHRAKPAGVQGAVVKWIVSDTPPTSIKVFTNSLLDTKSPITLDFEEEQRGKVVYFALAWQNTKGEMGHFGEIQSSIVP